MKALRGRWPVAAVFFAADLVSEDEARRRALLLWRRGSRALSFPEGLLLVFPAPRSLRVDGLPGEPLLGAESRFLARPLAPAELRLFPAEAVVLRQGGDFVCLPLAAGRHEDPAAWLDLAGAEVLDARSLGLQPAPPAFAAPLPPPDLRRSLGAPAAAPEGVETLRRLAAPRRSGLLDRVLAFFRRRRTTTSAERAAAPAPGGAGKVVRVARPPGLFARLLRIFRRSKKSEQQALAPAGPGLGDLLSRLALALGVWRWAGFAQMRYLRELYRAFERLDVDAILRRGLPLGEGDEGGGLPSLLPPSPRTELRITPPGGPGSDFSFGPELFLDLRQRYQQLAALLERRGELEKAAFVLAELLDRPQAAIALLERHQLFRQAAEIAALKRLAPALQVRLLFLAGDSERAVEVALVHDAFPALLEMLEKDGPRLPDSPREKLLALVRRRWSARLAAAGDYLSSVRVLWPLRDHRHETLQLVDKALADAEGMARGELLTYLLHFAPERAPEILEDWRRLLRVGDPELFETRRACGELLLAAPAGVPIAPLARATLRALLPDGGRPDLRRLHRNLAERGGDPILAAEIGVLAVPDRVAPLPVERPSRWRVGETRGGVAIADLQPLSGNRLLLAAGELGVFLLGPDGRTRLHFAAPAGHLAAAARASRAIAWMERDGVAVFHRLDLRAGRSEPWFAAPVEAAATNYDGQRFAIAREGAFELLDAVASGCQVLWRMPNLGGRVLAIASGAAGSYLAVESDRTWIWRLDRNLVLRAKDDVPWMEGGLRRKLFDLDDAGSCIYGPPGGDLLQLMRRESEVDDIRLPGHAEDARLAGDLLVTLDPPAAGATLRAFDLENLANPRELARLELPGARRPVYRLCGDLLACGDEHGRWLLADLPAGRVVAEGRFCG